MRTDSLEMTMVHRIHDATLFYVAQDVPYNDRPPLEVGSKISAGLSINPFYGFFERPRTYPVQLPDGTKLDVNSLVLLQNLRDGHLVDPNALSHAYDIAKHFQLLARELQMEAIRREVNPGAPSRQTCLWASTDPLTARHWQTRLTGANRVAVLSATGITFTADAALLPGDALAMSVLSENATKYWRGERSETPEIETLFAGEATVTGFLPQPDYLPRVA